MVVIRDHFHYNIEIQSNVGADLRVGPNHENIGLPNINAIMQISDAGKMVEKWYYELENKFPNVKCHAMVVIRDHFHYNIEIQSNVGADLRVGPNHENIGPNPILNERVLKSGERVLISGEHKGSPLHRMVQWFKTMTTNEYIHGVKQHHWPPFNGKLWQRNYR
ncbi:MAG: hypothetical protein MUF42_13305 [Cytophagaceae bacterium]|jgi:REP element-mobilizing transposase RayT|nr:hypothetical protein [Cytophagaceae bacterium]